MLSDIEIAQNACPKPISEIIEPLDIQPDEWEPRGRYVAKLDNRIRSRLHDRPDGRLVLVTAVNPTPAGEGKTTTTVGLGQALCQLGHRAVIALREPSLGPVFGMKGGAAGGGYAQVLPMESINLHFTGDIHAVTAANNLLSAIIDNHLQQGNRLGIDPRQITWKRCLDMNDRALRHLVVGLGGSTSGVPREDGFQISVASEVMAVLCLADSYSDLKLRLQRIVVARTYDSQPVTVLDLKADGAMAALLTEAMLPNLVQTLEGTPALMHGGPFANIAHGCNSLSATRLGLKLGDILVTEAGFGADLGAEKFFDIKCRSGGLHPDAAILVATVRALKYNGGVERSQLNQENLPALERGLANLEKHIENIRQFRVPCLVALNAFPDDTEAEVQMIRDLCTRKGVEMAVSNVFRQGGAGGIELAEKLIHLFDSDPSDFQPLYPLDRSLEEKMRLIACRLYGADDISLTAQARKQLDWLEQQGFSDLPVCMAKTQYSLSDDPTQLGRPEGFTLTVRELTVSAGAGFVVALTGNVLTMPGLPSKPAAESIDINENGTISGLF